MKYFLIPKGVFAVLFLGATVASAQTTFTARGYPDVTDAYQNGSHLYSKTWSDLNRAQKRAAASPGDWYRFDKARGQMDLLQRTWQDGSFTRSQLNDAIADVQFVLNFSTLSKPDRDALAQDLEQLRDIRVRYGQ